MLSFRSIIEQTIVTFLFLFLMCMGALAEQDERLTVYIDADYSVVPAPANAIEIGLRTAFAGTWAEDGIAIIPRDHRGNSRRSMDTIKDAQRDSSAIAVIGGMHSGPYFEYGAQINAGGMPLLLPWSAGGMLTRLAEGEDNWIFRLSVDDTKAAKKLVSFGVKSGCSKPSLVFVDNGWGTGNAARISKAFEAQGIKVVSRLPLAFNSGVQSTFEAVTSIDTDKTDCVFLISGLVLGKSVINALGEMETAPRVISHWGILGDRLTDHVSFDTMQRVRLSILGTCGLNEAKNHPEVYAHALSMARKISGNNFDPELHPAPHGFFHAHDLGLLLVQAIERARETNDWASGMDARRRAIREALYQLEAPIEGLLRHYASPFEPVGEQSFDGHEALGSNDLCMTGIDEAGYLVSLTNE